MRFMRMRFNSLSFWFLFSALGFLQTSRAQTVSMMSSTYSDDFTEWEILGDVLVSPADSVEGTEAEWDYETLGRLTLLWPQKRDLRDWQYDLDGKRGSIRQKWSNDKTHWELSDYDSRITMQPTYPGEIRDWRITDNHVTLNLRCRYGNTADEWLVDDERHGTFYMYTEREGDPRDWVIRNKLGEEVPAGMQMALAFIVLYFSLHN
jgi:hypothetical protein